MTQARGLDVLITGANSGIGKEVARQLALSGRFDTIHLGCRNENKGRSAAADLQQSTGKSIFRVVRVDTCDLDSVRRAADALERPLHGIVLNAGGMGGPTPMALTVDGVTELFAANVLGHVVMLEQLVGQKKLTNTAVLVGSEAARGVPKLRIPRPTFGTHSVEEFSAVIDGTYFDGRKPDVALAYGQAKYLGAQWMGALARRHPGLRLLTVSPGNTAGTGALRDANIVLRTVIAHVVLPYLGPALGLAHDVEHGARRLVDAVTDPAYRSGIFYASAANAITGSLIDQAEIIPELKDHDVQDRADEAIHRFLRPRI